MTGGIVVTVAGAKGGVGKTTTSINLGTAAVTETDRSVLLVEADLAMANVVDFLDLGYDPIHDPDLHDVMAERASIDEATYAVDSGLDVLPSGDSLDAVAEVDVRSLRPVVEAARSRYDVVLLDTAAGVSLKTILPLAVADGVVLVTTPRVSAVRDTKKTLEIVDRVDGEAAGVVIAQSGTGNAPPPERLADFLDVPLLGNVPADEAVNRSQDVGEAVVTYAPESPAAAGYLGVADALGLTARSATIVGDAGTSV